MSSSMLTNATIGTISNSSFNIGPSSEQLARDKLSAAAAHSALHDAPARTDDTRCHRNTRVNVLDNLERWAQGILEDDARLFWLYGGAGAGKSAIMQTLSECCAAKGIALGSFFFSRSDPTRNTATVLIPTLAYQVVQIFPDALQVLHPIIDRDALIFKKSLQVQLIDLLVRPLQYLVQLGKISDAAKSPRVFLIDGLDECDNPDQQQEIIRAVAAVCNEYHIPVKFLIASRPELPISTSFRSYKQSNHSLGSISLSEDPDADTDIQKFIGDEFVKICLHHPFNEHIPSEWPHGKDICTLVQKSSSHFIYASTVIKFIWSAKDNPARSLQVILGLEVSRTGSPFAELDALYHHIFQSAGHRDKVLQILEHCLFSPCLPSYVSMICLMYEYPLSDFYIFIADMTSLITISPRVFDIFDEKEIKLLHTSLGDFLCDPIRSGSFYLDRHLYLASNLQRCIQILDRYSQNQSTGPKWPVHSQPEDGLVLYNMLGNQIGAIISESGNLDAVQRVLSSISFFQLYEYTQRLQKMGTNVFFAWISDILLRICDSQSPISKRYVEEFLEIWESVMNPQSTPLASIILPLIFLGYPEDEMSEIFHYHFRGTPSAALVTHKTRGDSVVTYFNDVAKRIAISDASIRHRSANLSPERLAAAIEAILDHLVDKFIPSTCPNRKSCLLCTTPDKLVNLLNALVWLLPQAGFSEKIITFSRMISQQNSYWCKRDPCTKLQKCLDEYSIRVHNEMLEKHDRGIENGSIDALIDKSNMLHINAQD